MVSLRAFWNGVAASFKYKVFAASLYKVEFLWIFVFPLIWISRTVFQGNMVESFSYGEVVVSYGSFLIIGWLGWLMAENVMFELMGPFARKLSKEYFFSPGGLFARPLGESAWAYARELIRSTMAILFLAVVMNITFPLVGLLQGLVLIALVFPVMLALGLFGAAAAMRHKRNILTVARLILQVWVMVSLVTFTVDVLPKWMHPIVAINPFATFLTLLRAVIFEGVFLWDRIPEITFLVGSGLVSVYLSLNVFYYYFDKSRKDGRIFLA